MTAYRTDDELQDELSVLEREITIRQEALHQKHQPFERRVALATINELDARITRINAILMARQTVSM